MTKKEKYKDYDLWVDLELPNGFITKNSATKFLDDNGFEGEIPSKPIITKYKNRDIIIYVDTVGDLCVQLGTNPKIARVLTPVE